MKLTDRASRPSKLNIPFPIGMLIRNMIIARKANKIGLSQFEKG